MTLPVKQLNACRACPLRARPHNGHAPCTVDRVDWLHHVRAGYCSHPARPRFGKGEKPYGWEQKPLVPASWRWWLTMPRLPGPGDALAGAIKAATLGRVKMCATCKSRRRQMNEWGWRECVRHPVRLGRLFLKQTKG